MIGELSPMHWLVVVVVFMVLFGAKRLPDAARSLGRSVRILKAELGADDTAAGAAARTSEPTWPPTPPPLPPT